MTYVAVGGGSGICVEERAVEGYRFAFVFVVL